MTQSRTYTSSLLTDELLEQLRAAVTEAGRACILVPSYQEVVDTYRALAGDPELSLGVTVSTPASFVRERWEVAGDARREVSSAQRTALMTMLLDAHDRVQDPAFLGGEAHTAGLVELLCQVARELMGQLPLAEGRVQENDPRVAALSAAECDALEVVAQYAAELEARGLIELAEMAHLLPRLIVGAGVACDPLVVAGFDSYEPWAADLLGQLEEQGAVRYRMSRAVVLPAADLAPLTQLEAAGPLAEAELVAHAITALPAEAEQVLVVVSDTDRAWRELAPKLAARGVLVRGGRRRQLADLPAVQAFLGFMRSIAALQEAAAAWDATPGVLNDMSWWPPRALTDFLLSEISGVSAARSWALDAKFRKNRALTPDEALKDLSKETLTSRACSEAASQLLSGRPARALKALLWRQPDALSAEARTTLQEIAALIASFAQVGIYVVGDATPEAGGHTISLERMADLLEQELEHSSYAERLELGTAEASLHTVEIIGRTEALALSPQSYDVVVACGMSAEAWPLAPAEGAFERLAEHLGCVLDTDELAHARAQLAHIMAAPRLNLMVERATHTASGAESYPAPMLLELLDLYQRRGAKVATPPVELGETEVSRELSAAGAQPAQERVVARGATGEISETSRALIVPPRDGSDTPPALSATQIESYLECPYKWFTLRRLGLENSDAEFSPLEQGVLVHRTLELTYARLIEEAAEREGLVCAPSPRSEEAAFSQTELAAPYLASAAATPATLPHATELLAGFFEQARAEQSTKIIPHTPSELYQLERIEPQLEATLAFEAPLFLGFAPRYTEWRFGRKTAAGQAVSYAGVELVGTADRIDTNASGQALVIDYKHKKGGSIFTSEYDVFGEDACCDEDGVFRLPRRVQALIYAQVMRRELPDFEVVGALYLATRGIKAADHSFAGMVDGSAAVGLGGVSDKRREKIEAGFGANMPFAEVLDRAEEAIAAALERLFAGEIEPNPKDARACEWCPAASTCERRLV